MPIKLEAIDVNDPADNHFIHCMIFGLAEPPDCAGKPNRENESVEEIRYLKGQVRNIKRFSCPTSCKRDPESIEKNCNLQHYKPMVELIPELYEEVMAIYK